MQTEETEQNFIKVTVICGFLGAGKTTLLNRILAQSGGRKLAVLVNDLGKINIDASEVENTVSCLGGAISGMVELSSGCICCGVRSELLDALHELIVEHGPEEIVIEATGAAEPRQLLENIYGYNLYRADFGNYVEVKNAITVVSARELKNTIEASKNGALSNKRLLNIDPRRPLSELQFSQIECSDYILLNKTDAVVECDVPSLVKTLEGLNSKAQIVKSRFAQVDIEELFSHTRFDKKKTLEAAHWNLDLINNRSMKFVFGGETQSQIFLQKTKHSDYGIASFVYNARRPFDEAKFLKFIRKGIRGLLRAKGYFWSAEHPDTVGFLSICADIQRIDYGTSWWKTRVERAEIAYEHLPPNVQTVWDSECGDKRQEIVFIGVDMAQESIKSGLDVCLIS